MRRIVTKNEEETLNAGFEFADKLKKGDIVGLIGELGAGKTVFAKGIAKKFGIAPENVTSPTFTIINEYETERIKVFHFDLYRIKNIFELEDLGYEEYFYNDGIVIIEWAEKIEKILPKKTYFVYLFCLNENQREIVFKLKR
jgi:tRNA threonylcarbamoyladenosine biosynthesis protein TsaE